MCWALSRHYERLRIPCFPSKHSWYFDVFPIIPKVVVNHRILSQYLSTHVLKNLALFDLFCFPSCFFLNKIYTQNVISMILVRHWISYILSLHVCRVFLKKYAIFLKNVPWVKLHWYNQKYLYNKRRNKEVMAERVLRKKSFIHFLIIKCLILYIPHNRHVNLNLFPNKCTVQIAGKKLFCEIHKEIRRNFWVP
jgi:hypothetical protein